MDAGRLNQPCRRAVEPWCCPAAVVGPCDAAAIGAVSSAVCPGDRIACWRLGAMDALPGLRERAGLGLGAAGAELWRWGKGQRTVCVIGARSPRSGCLMRVGSVEPAMSPPCHGPAQQPARLLDSSPHCPRRQTAHKHYYITCYMCPSLFHVTSSQPWGSARHSFLGSHQHGTVANAHVTLKRPGPDIRPSKHPWLAWNTTLPCSISPVPWRRDVYQYAYLHVSGRAYQAGGHAGARHWLAIFLIRSLPANVPRPMLRTYFQECVWGIDTVSRDKNEA